MAFDTYDNLLVEIENWLDDSSLTASIPGFISLAEPLIRSRLKLLEMERIATATLPTDSDKIALPSGYTEMITFELSTTPVTILTYKTPTQLQRLYSTTARQPYYYTIVDGQIKFDCIPDQAYTTKMVYYKLDDLSSSNQTNIVFGLYPAIYLYEALLQGAAFLDEDDTRASKWANALSRAYDAAEESDDGKRFSGELSMRRDGTPP